jgi:CMP-N-acetylneuraminic acid synthetase
MMNNKPMLAYSIEHALASQKINRVIVSTDGEDYAQIAKALDRVDESNFSRQRRDYERDVSSP